MTGFGRGAAAGEQFSVSVEIKTVNNRFLDVNLRLPGDLQSLEPAIKRQITSRLSRGRVDVNLTFDRQSEVSYELNKPMIEGYVAALRQLKADFDLAGEPDINSIVRLPNVIVAKKADNVDDDFIGGVESAVSAALDDLEKMRETEGAALGAELESRLKGIEDLLPGIESEAGSVAQEYQQKLTKRIDEILQRTSTQIEIDPGRLAQEVAFLADRADISEEITRLKVHIDQYRSIMKEDKEVGKRLDFLTQELNREANTISSKTTNMKVKENALAIKSEVEKIREQIQNIE